jgi:hypothetical protein
VVDERVLKAEIPASPCVQEKTGTSVLSLSYLSTNPFVAGARFELATFGL